MGRFRKFKTEKQMEAAWEAFKQDCDNQSALVTDFSSRTAKHVSSVVKRRITYTIEGFCSFAGLARRAFYDTYANDPKFSHIVSLMKEECEVDVRKKFELQEIPPQLAPLWMSKFGYTTKVEQKVDANLEMEKTKLDDLIGQLRSDSDES